MDRRDFLLDPQRLGDLARDLAWARQREMALGSTGLNALRAAAELRNDPRSTTQHVAVPPKPAPAALAWCQIRGCDSPAVHHEPERLCPEHLENLWSWTKRPVSPKVDTGATLA